ncbi:MAG: hypothetical protein H0W62_01815 [Chitinophagales bacterium]|nr:hypothetical protein [Chitinophagales bacterium]
MKWGSVVHLPNNQGFEAWHTYRAKNAFGGKILVKQVFFFDEQGNITSVQNDEP